MKEITFKYFEDQATEAEKEQLLNWLRKKENREVFNNFKLEWKKSLEPTHFPAGGIKTWGKLETILGQKNYNRWHESFKLQKIYRIAAIFFLMVTLGTLARYFMQHAQYGTETFTRVMAEKGQIAKVKLPDGSLVWLNSGSEIAYNNFFSVGNRDITLDGEAYFDVTENKELPLIVDCGELKVKVLGTCLNVNTIKHKQFAEVVLEEGRVELLRPNNRNPFYRMKPGEWVKVNLVTKKYAASFVNTQRYTSWKEGIINFYNLSIEEVVKQLEKRYNQKFELAPEVKELRYTFSIENESLEDILKLMERITPIKAKQKDGVIKIEYKLKF